VRNWFVGGALIARGDGLLLVGNRRRDNTLDWSPPGGVIDEGETLHEGLAREVREETGLIVSNFSRCAYHVEVAAPGLGWLLKVEAWEVEVEGTIALDDPDGIVEHCRAASASEARELLAAGPLWIDVPVGAWLESPRPTQPVARHDPPVFRFRLNGTDRRSTTVEHLT
jgi:8-oxo-dGTP diphosphatase